MDSRLEDRRTLLGKHRSTGRQSLAMVIRVYPLHSHLRLRVHVLLGIADSRGILVLGHAAHGRRGSRRCVDGTRSHGLGSCRET